jgi:Flp pilus assembly protein TadD
MRALHIFLFIALGLTACKTVPNEFGDGDVVEPLTVEERIQIAARNAAVEASQGRVVAGALRDSEKRYRSNPKSGTNALTYATDLRKAGLVEQAQLVLRPFAIDPQKSSPDILVEYSKIKLKLGDFEGAQIYAQEAMILNNNYAPAYHVLGVAVDAQGHHQAAENHFKKALSMVSKDDPLHTAITNNLSLSLIAQGKNAEAESVLSLSNPQDTLAREITGANQSLINDL